LSTGYHSYCSGLLLFIIIIIIHYTQCLPLAVSVPPLNDPATRNFHLHYCIVYITYMIRYIAASCRGSDTNTTAAAAADSDDEDDASQCDVIANHPEHLLLSSMDSCPATRFVLCFITIVVILMSTVMTYDSVI